MSRHFPIGLAASVLCLVTAAAAAQPGYIPNFQTGTGGWQHPFGAEMPAVQGSALPMRQDPKHDFVGPGQSWRIADLSNPNLMQWARDVIKKDTDEIDNGKMQFSANSSCVPYGVPMFLLAGGPLHILQSPNKIVMLQEGSQFARHIYLNVRHSASVKPSWYGESVGHYEGDTLVVDTIGLNTRTFVDNFRTPHTEKLHVTERWRMVEPHTLQVDFTVDDPGTFHQPWRSYQQFRRVQGALVEDICAENNKANLFDYGMPEAKKPDF